MKLSFFYKSSSAFALTLLIILAGGSSAFAKCSETKIDKDTIANKEKHKNYRACSTHPHSYVVEFLSENGIVGFLFFIIFLFIICSKIIKSRKYLKNDYIAIGIGSLIVAIVFPFKPSGSFFSTFNASILFYLLGFFLYYTRELKK